MADQGNHRVQKFDSAGNFVSEWGSEGSGDGELLWPYSVAVDTTGHPHAMASRITVGREDTVVVLRYTPDVW